jgi:hypothetical protein
MIDAVFEAKKEIPVEDDCSRRNLEELSRNTSPEQKGMAKLAIEG